MSKKRSLSALGATLLAGVTLATMVAPAANAATAAPAATTHATGKLIGKNPVGSNSDFFAAVDSIHPGQSTVPFNTLKAAEEAAMTVTLPARGVWTQLTSTGSDGQERCLDMQRQNWGTGAYWTTCIADTPNSQFWKFDGEGRMVSKSNEGLWVIGTTNANSYGMLQMGSGKPVEFVGDFAAASREGLSVEGSFSGLNSDRATITGTGAANAPITIKNTAGDVVASGTADADGAFSIPVTAPNKGGVYALNVTQTVDGTESAAVKVDLDYGKAVAISTPANNADHTAGEVAMTGTGTPGGTITVFDNAGSTPIGNATVNASGAWALNTSALNAAEHKLEVKQLSKGNNTTTSTITLNPGGEGIAFVPLTITSDAGYTAGQSKTLSGRATPGATISIVNEAFNTVVGRATADAQGEWAFARVFGPSATYSLKFVQESAKGNDQITGYRLAPVTEMMNDLAISSDHVYTAGVNKTITGTATPGATIVAKNQWGTVVGNAKADNTMSGNWSFTRQYGPTASYTLTFTQTTIGGKTQTLDNWTLAPAIAEAPLTITSDDNNDTYRPGVHTFAGTGTPSATITATNQWGTSLGDTTVNDKGTWTFDRNLGPTANYQITFTQTFNGKTDTVNLALKAPVHAAFVLTSPTVGATYTPGVQTTFTGTTTPFATVNVATDLGTPIAEVEADKKGNWSFKRAYGPTRTYTLNFTATDLDGTTDTLNGYTWAPTTS